MSRRNQLEYGPSMWKCQCDCGRYRNSDVLVSAGLLIAPKVLAAHTGVLLLALKLAFQCHPCLLGLQPEL